MPNHPALSSTSLGPLHFATVAAVTLLLSTGSFAQSVDPNLIASATTTLALPDAPGALAPVSVSSSTDVPAAPDSAYDPGPKSPPAGKMVGHFDKYIQPGEVAPKISAYDKVLLGIRDAVSPLSAAGWIFSASYEQITNGTPNYPQTGKGYAQRLGAAAARAGSEGIFGDSVLSPILHEDPRYYRMGPGHNIFKRATYSATRAIFVRTDGGHQTINFGNIGGNLGGSVLTQLYYPHANRSVNEVAITFGGSVGGSALGFLASEFVPDILQGLHLQRRP